MALDRWFSDISEISNVKDKLRFTNFWELNKLIENEKVTKKQIYNAYTEVLLDEWVQNYSELHFQIKYLLEEIKVSCNDILWFYDYKINYYLNSSIELINGIYEIPPDGKKYLIDFLTWKSSLQKLHLNIVSDWTSSPIDFIIDRSKNSDKEVYYIIYDWSCKMEELINQWVLKAVSIR